MSAFQKGKLLSTGSVAKLGCEVHFDAATGAAVCSEVAVAVAFGRL